MNITICDICGKRMNNYKPMITGSNVMIEEYQCGAKIGNFDICSACNDRISHMIDDMRSKHDVNILG